MAEGEAEEQLGFAGPFCNRCSVSASASLHFHEK